MLTSYYCKAHCKHNKAGNCQLDFTTIDIAGQCIAFEEKE